MSSRSQNEEGIKLFSFHGKINEALNGREAGTFSRDITKANNGRWTFFEPYSKLKEGDVLCYWTYVDYFDGKKDVGYIKDDQEFLVEDLINGTHPKIDARSNVPPKSCKSSGAGGTGSSNVWRTGYNFSRGQFTLVNLFKLIFLAFFLSFAK